MALNQIAGTTWKELINAVDEAFEIQIGGITATPDGSSLSDFPPYTGAVEKLSALLGFEVRGNESLFELAGRLAVAD